MTESERRPKEFPPQTQQRMPGAETEMSPEPFYDNPEYKGSGLLKNKVALITGGDSGIGRSVAVFYAREVFTLSHLFQGADVSIVYYEHHKDAEKTKQLVEKEGKQCLLIAGDVTKKDFCEKSVKQTIDKFGQLDILVNHAGVQWEEKELENITEEHLDLTFKTNVYAYFFMAQAAVPHLKRGSCIINTTSVNAYKGNSHMMDYAASKGAEMTMTYSLAQNLAPKGIRVNAVAPGPIWTPFIPSTFEAESVKKFGQNTPLGRAGQPEECAPAYVFLASNITASYITGQSIHPNGGKFIGV